MNNRISYIVIMTLGVFAILNTAAAEDAENARKAAMVNINLKAVKAPEVVVFEMAESGVTIEFPMTAAEIAAEDAENALRTAKTTDTKIRLKRIELAESGFVFEFPMTAEEIAAEDAENARKAAMVNINLKAVKAPEVIVFEMAESGQTIEFYKAAPRMATELLQTEIAKENPEESGASMR